ncbi:Sigma-G inhibitor, Gin [Paenibacillus curdlanolyticus YK9]|uniref:Sigma-G inhibitor, Gin n=1 Tax=Paenibacillus curdlanolyticus YK9 TaxID=717606 RepID=E0I974_9BACL|nr:sigma factor G inhibitor Gin [Paenibacillus curdlanolyticus]EFM10958.1 Sigma-G inhibitor, Gin [Paenibacillus curdlanolyticus YK9]
MEEQQQTCKCIICGEFKREEEGIHIVTEFICEDCEVDMVATDVNDDRYPFYIHQMKQIWVQRNA